MTLPSMAPPPSSEILYTSSVEEREKGLILLYSLASFVTTYMEEEAEKLMVDGFAKNFIDYEEYPVGPIALTVPFCLVLDL